MSIDRFIFTNISYEEHILKTDRFDIIMKQYSDKYFHFTRRELVLCNYTKYLPTRIECQ